MSATLKTQRVRTLEQVRAFVEGSESVDVAEGDREGAYASEPVNDIETPLFMI